MFITASSMNTYAQCARKYEYSYIKEKRPSKPQAALLTGTAVHLGLESWWNKQDFVQAMDAIKKFQTESPFWSTDAGCIEAARVRAYVAGYYRHRSGFHDRYDVVGVEQEFKFTLEGVEFRGKIDLLLRDRDGRTHIVDHKTSGSRDLDDPGSPFWSKLQFDTQMVLYRLAAEEIVGSSGTPTLVYDVVRKTKSKPAQRKRISKKKSETEFQYEARKLDNTETTHEYQNRIRQTYQEDGSRYIWRVIPLPSHQFEEKREEIIQVAGQMSEPHMLYPRNQNSCITLYGQCPFFSVCCGAETLDSPSFENKPAHSELNQGKDNGPKI